MMLGGHRERAMKNGSLPGNSGGMASMISEGCLSLVKVRGLTTKTGPSSFGFTCCGRVHVDVFGEILYIFWYFLFGISKTISSRVH